VIQIIREEDEPKPVMMAEFGLTDRQAEAILNMRLRSLRRLEEMELTRERATLDAEGKELEALIASPARQRTRMKRDLAALRERYGPETALGARRTLLSEAAPAREIPLEAMVEREPVTVILSQRGWIRAMKGHLDEAAQAAVKFKEGDGPAHAIRAQTTDRILLATDQGRFYTLPADKLPGGRGFGEPVRLFADIDADARVAALLAAKPGAELLLASGDGKGFVVDMADVTAETRKGKQVVNLREGGRLKVVHPVAPTDDYVAAIGDNRKMVIFPLGELPRMARGQGVTIQRYKDGGLSDAISFRLDDGLSWTMRAARGAAGRMPPVGFPRDNRFRG
jgi:topoisomerase-4 subunit A